MKICEWDTSLSKPLYSLKIQLLLKRERSKDLNVLRFLPFLGERRTGNTDPKFRRFKPGERAEAEKLRNG